jgi:hypothetical protein
LLNAICRLSNPCMRRFSALVFVTVPLICTAAQVAATSPAGFASALQLSPTERDAVDQLIPWLLEEGRQLRGIAFSEVIFDTTGKRVLNVDRDNEVDRRVIKQIAAACDETMKRLNAPDSPIQQVERINEVSSHFEESLRELLNSALGLSCDFPRSGDGKVQRSGYPDLRIVDLASKRIYYLDPKLYAAGSRDSSFRTFYFEPKVTTNKVRDDAVHLIVGFEHEPRDVATSLSRGGTNKLENTATRSTGSGQAPRHRYNNAVWRFTHWALVDLANFRVKLKAEFQASNRDLYRPEAIIATSAQQ